MRKKARVAMPATAEQLRRRLRLEGNLWAVLATRFANRTWLADFSPSVYAKFTDHILGKRCAELEIKLATSESADGANVAPRPPWSLILSYEYQLRKAAFRRVRDDNVPLAVALLEATASSELRELFFTSPLALLPRQAKRGGEPTEDPRWAPKPRRDKGQKGRRAKGHGKSKPLEPNQPGRTPDGRLVCFNYNRAGARCPGSCNMLHVCLYKDCHDKHPAYQCPKHARAGVSDAAAGTGGTGSAGAPRS